MTRTRTTDPMQPTRWGLDSNLPTYGSKEEGGGYDLRGCTWVGWSRLVIAELKYFEQGNVN